MNIFAQATKEKLRFATKQGPLSTEQLWEVKLTPLAVIVRNLKKELNKDNDDELSFLDESPAPVDKTAELRFEVAKAVYVARREERDAEKNAAAKKERNQEILRLIADKQNEELKGKTVEELQAMLQD